jgi:molecular chaperone Hsp33
MERTDQLWRGTASKGNFRIMAVDATQATQAIRDLHDLSPVNTLLLGKMLSAAAMLSLDLKVEDAEVTLRLDGDGPLKGALVICNGRGELRGYALKPGLWLGDPAENFYLVKHLGTGTLSVIRSQPGKRPTHGFTSLSEGEVAQNLAHFFEQSEQVPSAVNLGVLIGKDASVKASGGFIIQQLPSADPLEADRIIANLQKTPNVSDLMDMGLTLPGILKKFVFPETDLDIQEVHPISYRCNCSRERFARALSLLDTAELEEMRDGIDPQCHFCNASYHFSGEDIDAIIKSKGER